MTKSKQSDVWWRPFPVQSGECLKWSIERTDLYVMKEGTSWYVYSEGPDKENGEEKTESGTGKSRQKRHNGSKTSEKWVIGEKCKKIPDLPWERYISGEEETIRLSPIVPDKPLVLFPEIGAQLLPGKVARFAVQIPLWLRLYTIEEKRENLLCEIPTKEFSYRWFGDPMSGELCYSLTSPFVENFESLEPGGLSAFCFIRIRNGSSFQLDLQKFLLHAEYLYLFESGLRLWTDEVTFQFRGTEQSSQISFSKRPPKEAKQAKLIAQPRIPAARNIIKRSFDVLKYVTGD